LGLFPTPPTFRKLNTDIRSPRTATGKAIPGKKSHFKQPQPLVKKDTWLQSVKLADWQISSERENHAVAGRLVRERLDLEKDEVLPWAVAKPGFHEIMNRPRGTESTKIH
jgi:hypothetical protein